MIVLVLNCGSSSVKFQVLEVAGQTDALPRRLAGGAVERIGRDAAVSLESAAGQTFRAIEDLADQRAAVHRALGWARATGLLGRVEAVGHRVVHGGDRFQEPVVIDDAVVAGIEALASLAPLHNAPSLAGIDACRTALGPEVPMVAVFDTAFHATLPEAARRYAVAWELAERHGIRRYGFHGTSFRSVLGHYARVTGTPASAARLVVLHLGSGCSAAAIAGGRSVETSMGMTPLEGLVMATRSGDLDPGVIGYLQRQEGAGVEAIEGWLQERSGLLGLSGRSASMADLLAAEADDPRARLAVDVFCHRARKYVGAYLAVLNGADAVVFTGGIGERAPTVRARIASGLEWCGLTIDEDRNLRAVGEAARISTADSTLAAWVIPTNEEAVIARDTVETLMTTPTRSAA
jgi:acetate kinase